MSTVQTSAVSSAAVALLAEGVDRNIKTYGIAEQKHYVALLAEGVDRNTSASGSETAALVALLAEGVDRNIQQTFEATPLSGVALLAEGVDRNLIMSMPIAMSAKSPSSRRAWIEMKTRRRISSMAYRRPPRGGRG